MTLARFPRPGVEELRGGARDGGDATAGAEDDAEASQEAAEDCHRRRGKSRC